MSDKEALECLQWLEKEKKSLEGNQYGANKKSIGDDLDAHRHKVKVIREYKDHLGKVSHKIKRDDLKESLIRNYENLSLLSQKRLDCLETMAGVSSMEDMFGTLVGDVVDRSTRFVEEMGRDSLQTRHTEDGVAHAAQSCILGVRNNWSWLSRMVRCTDVHVKHAGEYHQFFHDLSEYNIWLPAELGKVVELVTPVSLKGTREDAARLLVELKTALTIFLTWQGKADGIFDRARKIVPIHYRSRKLDHQRPVTSLCNYKTNDVNIQEGEELILLNNTHAHNWLVRTSRGTETYVPSIICLIPSPDPNAVNLALRLRLQLLGLWTNELRRIGQTLVEFLLLIFRDWTPEEREVLKALPAPQKKELEEMCNFLDSSLAQYWSEYPGYKTLKGRLDLLRQLMRQPGNPKYQNSEMGRALVVQIGVVQDLMKRYNDLWRYWESYKVLVEVCRHAELVLISERWEDLKFMDTLELLKRWHITKEITSQLTPHMAQQTTASLQNGAVGSLEGFEEETALTTEEEDETDRVEGEVYNVETATETAEAEHISSAEQEERKTFVITSVVDPRSGKEVSMDEAVKRGIINQSNGTYVNADTDVTLPIPVAMNAGWIKVEYTSTKKSAERRRDIGLITIRTQKESRPYTVMGVKDVATDRILDVDEAVADKLIDFDKNMYHNRVENHRITIADALDSGLLEVEIDEDAPVSDAHVETKTYAIYAVLEQSTGKNIPFGDAVRRGLVDPTTGAYYHNVKREQIYVGDAIRKGYIKASVVKDPKSLDVAPENMVVIENGR